MKNSHRPTLAAAFAAVLCLSCLNGPVGAEESATVPTDLGYPGDQEQAPSQSSEVTNIPTPDETRRALMTPISKQPSLGNITTAGSASDSRESKTEAPPTSSTIATAAGEPPPSGPIGSVGETIPAKFSKRNDILDRTPIMALPLPLSDQQRKQIYDAVMADNSQPVAGADALKPASELSPNQALNGMHPLPESVRGIDGVTRLCYLKAKGKVLLVEPATRTVVGEITS
jgi:hypothetical protein